MSARTHHPNFGSSKYSLTWRPAKPESVSQVILSVEPSFNLRENQTLRHGFSSDIWFGPPWFERLATRKKQKQTVSMVWWSNLYVGHPHHRGTHPRRRCKTRSIHCRWPKLIGPGAKSSEIQAVQLEIRYAVSNGHEFCMSVRKLIGLFFVSLSTVLYASVCIYIVYSNCNVLHILKERERELCMCAACGRCGLEDLWNTSKIKQVLNRSWLDMLSKTITHWSSNLIPHASCLSPGGENHEMDRNGRVLCKRWLQHNFLMLKVANGGMEWNGMIVNSCCGSFPHTFSTG